MKFASLLIVFFLLISCQTLPAIKEPASQEQNVFICPHPFVQQKTTFIHSIEVQMSGNIKSAVIGITEVNPATLELACVIMSIEGMVLFEAREKEGFINVSRALPPFDSARFAKNMIEDINLIFFAPNGKPKIMGYLPEGKTVCRWCSDNSDIIDVVRDTKGFAEVKRYTSCGQLKRYVKFSNTPDAPYKKIDLHADELSDYNLIMTLIESRPFNN